MILGGTRVDRMEETATRESWRPGEGIHIVWKVVVLGAEGGKG